MVDEPDLSDIPETNFSNAVVGKFYRPKEGAVDNQHTLIKGYRDLSQEEIDLMNEIKAVGERLGELVTKVRNTAGTDPRWAAEGNTDLQKGIMCLVRSVAKPTTF